MEAGGGRGWWPAAAGGEDRQQASVLVGKAIDMLSLCMNSGLHLSDHSFFYRLLVSLARAIDHAVADNEIPSRSKDLPLLLKQVYKYKNELFLEAAFLVLMTSVKSACKVGWFPSNEAAYLLMLAKEVRRSFTSTEDICIEPYHALPYLSKIFSRFYPGWKMKRILAFLEVKPGYGVYVTDFHVSRGMLAPKHESISLFVARTDNMHTSSCIVTPPEVNFLVNGKGVQGRTNASMDNGPQFPTDVTEMVQYGTNVLQTVGQFQGGYVIVISSTSIISVLGSAEFQDYVNPVVAAVHSDMEIIQAPSQISLNCPLSQRRMKIPVKGQLCKHLQCFDYENFLQLNSRRPTWQCPLCRQSVSYQDIRMDQIVLREVDGNVVHVMISADGSWSPVSEKARSTFTSGQTQNNQQKDIDQCDVSNNVLNKDRVNDLHQNFSVSLCSSAAITSLSGADKVNKISNNSPSNAHLFDSADSMSVTEGRQNATTFLMQNQTLNPINMQSQYDACGCSTAGSEYGKFPSLHIHASKSPGAVLPLPWQNQVSRLNEIQRSSDTSMLTGRIYGISDIKFSIPHKNYGCNPLKDGTEKCKVASQLHTNASAVSAMPSSAVEHNLYRQNCFKPPLKRQNQEHPRPQNMTSTASLNLVHAYSHFQLVPKQFPQKDQEGLSAGIAQQAISRGEQPYFPVRLTGSTTNSTSSVSGLLGSNQGQSMHVGVQLTSGQEVSVAVAPENRRPSRRMRGALTGEAYSTALKQLMSAPTQAAHASQPPPKPIPTYP